MLRPSALVILALFATAGAQARTLEVGLRKAYHSPSAAVAAAQPGDTVAIYPGQYADCAVVPQDNLTIQGIGEAEMIVMMEKACEGKALLVIRGENVTVRNLTLAHVRITEGNGAGIRGESRSIVVDKVRFIANQNGILSGTEGGTLIIRDSDFEKNGFCGRACSHGVYAGHYDLLHIENSRFFNTRQAHHIKSRAHRTEIIRCDIQDGPDGTASYEIEAPNGGSVIVRDSKIIKGPHAENQTAAIMIGSEGVTQPTPDIVIENNRFRNEGSFPTIFVANLTTTAAQLSGNQLSGIGPVRALKGDGKVIASK